MISNMIFIVRSILFYTLFVENNLVLRRYGYQTYDDYYEDEYYDEPVTRQTTISRMKVALLDIIVKALSSGIYYNILGFKILDYYTICNNVKK